MGSILKYGALALAAFAGYIYITNSNLTAAARTEQPPTLLAHRGIAQRFDERDLKADTCTASRMLPPVHDYLENTIASMKASFDAGADIIELDIHPTTDAKFAVFHDWTLECRTDGKGVTRQQSMEDLRKLDIGYGYTADGGATFPFRGKGIGLMPTLDEVFTTFPKGRFLINTKSKDASEGQKLAQFLQSFPPERRKDVMVFGADKPVNALAAILPDVKTTTKPRLLSCLKSYAAWGWTGIVPEVCRNTVVYVPVNIGPWLWGWPDRFLTRMEAAGSAVYAIGPYHGSGFSSGVDTQDDLAKLPRGYSGGIMTNEIEAMAKATGK